MNQKKKKNSEINRKKANKFFYGRESEEWAGEGGEREGRAQQQQHKLESFNGHKFLRRSSMKIMFPLINALRGWNSILI